MENLENQEMENTESVNRVNQNVLADAEWCFQFDGEEPIIFAWSNKDEENPVFNLTVPAIEGTAATFKCPNTGKTFSILVRPISQETIQARESYATQQ